VLNAELTKVHSCPTHSYKWC